MSWAGIRREIKDILDVLEIRNLVDNPSVETDTTGFSSSTITLTQDSGQFRFGANSLKAAYSASVVERITLKKRDGNRFPVTPGYLYTFSHEYKPDAVTTGAFHTDIAWFDGGGGEISKVFGTGYAGLVTSGSGSGEDASIITVAAGADWARNHISGIAPDNAVTAELRIEENIALGAGEVMYYDGFMFCEADNPAYIDGTQPGCSWVGTAHQSASRRMLKKIHVNQPGVIQDTPCAIIIPPAIEIERRPSGWRRNAYTVRVRVLVSDADSDQAAALADAYRERLITGVDAAVRLQGAATVILDQRFEEGGGFQYPVNTGKIYAGFDCLLTVRDDEGVTYAV